ncbi:MAG: choice-of-anchor A family protein, partial [Clostridia bacterium]|nr:choice-of-anchor A family protein [Clostridia bacterium]
MEIVMTKRFVAFLLTALLTCLPLLTGLSDYSSEFYAKVQSIALDDMMQGEGNQDYLLSIDEPADIIVHSTGCEVYIGGNSEERQYLESGIYKIHVLSEGEYSLQIVKADAYNARSEEIGNSDDEYIRMVSVPVNHGSGTLSLSFDETAGIPETAEFLAEALDPLSEEYEQYAEAACAGFTGKSGILGLYDLKILQDGNIIEPEAPVTVTMDIDGEIPSDATIYAIHFPGSTQDNLAVNKPLKAPNAKNITQASGGVVLSQLDLETIPVVHNGPRSISFVAASFSVFAIVYTVDFHYEVNGKTVEFSIPGGGFTTLADVVEMLGIAEFDENTNPSVEDVDATQAVKEFISQVVSVNFSDDTLVWVGKVEEDTTIGAIKDSLGLVYEYSSELSEDEIEEINGSIVTAGDWAIISLKPFTSDEELMITMKNGDVWTAQVTDASVKYIPGQPFVYEDAAIKVTAVGVGADIPDEAELVVTQITADMEVYDSYFKALNRGFGDNPYNGFNSLLYDVSIIVDGREYEPEKGRIEIKLEFKAHQLSSMLGQNLDEDVPLRVIHLPVVDETCESSIEDVDASQIEREYIETTIIGHDDTEAVSFSLDSLSVITVTGASTDVTITSSLMGTDMKSLGYNLYAVLVSATEDKTYSVKVDYTNGTFSGTIPNVPVGNYQLMLAYDINNGNVQIDMPKGTFIGHSNLVRIDKSGQYVFGYAAQMPEDKTISTSDNTVSFALQVSEVQSSVNVATIMDRAINYGLVANELHLPNNCYTNFATKKLDIQNQNTQTYYGHRSDGINVVHNIAADVTNHGQPLTTETNQAANYYVTDEDKGKVNSTNQEETIVRNKNEIEDRVEIMISNTLKQAEELAKQSSIVLPNGLLSVDVSPYAENATIVLDATALSGIQNGFTIVKRPGQTVIFNINGQNAAPPQNTKIKLVDDKGQQIGNIREAGDNMRDAPASDGNVWNKVIWNFPDATSVTANNNIGGVFLVPKGDFTATNKGGGWIVARGKVSVTNEWYGFPGSDEPFKQKIIRKTFIGIEGNHIDA